MRTTAELTVLAEDILNGKIYGTWMGDNAVDSFPILRLAGVPEGAYHAFEYLDKAGPLAINGQPMFFGCQFLAEEEAREINGYMALLKENREKYMAKEGK